MTEDQTFNKFDVVIISCLVFLVWSIIMVTAYYGYQVCCYRDEPETARLDESSQSTTMLYPGEEDDEGDEEQPKQPRGESKVMIFLKDLKTDFHDYFFATTYDLTVNVDNNNKVLIRTTVVKGDLGLGLAIRKKNKHLTEITGFKEFPPTALNPSTMCSPPILPEDCIVGVNGVAVRTFATAVQAITAAPSGEVVLHLRR